MELTEPKVELIASTQVDGVALQRYLNDIGADEFKLEDNGIEGLTVVAGKVCYKSFQAGLNPNVSKVRDDMGEYLDNISKTGHGSVQEHGSATFIFWDVSRVFCAELIRHRAGTAMSEQSLRFYRLNKLSAWVPSCIKENEKGLKLFLGTLDYLEKVQQQLAEIYAIDGIKSFHKKKTLTSAFRRVAPLGLATAIVWTMNMRAARHIIQLRTSRHAEEEIRIVFDKVAIILKEKYPLMFQDFSSNEVEGIGEWTSKYAAAPYDMEKIKGAKSI
jgi:thymidylate synthase (FAD)